MFRKLTKCFLIEFKRNLTDILQSVIYRDVIFIWTYMDVHEINDINIVYFMEVTLFLLISVICTADEAGLFTSDNGRGYVFVRTPAFVCLPVCLSVCVQDYSKTRAWIWMKSCVSTDVGTWTN